MTLTVYLPTHLLLYLDHPFPPKTSAVHEDNSPFSLISLLLFLIFSSIIIIQRLLCQGCASCCFITHTVSFSSHSYLFIVWNPSSSQDFASSTLTSWVCHLIQLAYSFYITLLRPIKSATSPFPLLLSWSTFGGSSTVEHVDHLSDIHLQLYHIFCILEILPTTYSYISDFNAAMTRSKSLLTLSFFQSLLLTNLTCGKWCLTKYSFYTNPCSATVPC